MTGGPLSKYLALSGRDLGPLPSRPERPPRGRQAAARQGGRREPGNQGTRVRERVCFVRVCVRVSVFVLAYTYSWTFFVIT